jgi:hypothetical protein
MDSEREKKAGRKRRVKWFVREGCDDSRCDDDGQRPSSRRPAN